MRMNITKSFSSVFIVLSSFLMTTSFQQKEVMAPAIDQEELLARHNFYRSKVGVPPLVWSDELTEYAQNWANHLSKSCDLVHSDSPYGENIYWTSGTATPTEVVDTWASEERYYNHKNTVYRSSTGRRTGHYSQLIWRNTTEVGGAMQKCKHGGEIWVCSYNPYGNVINSKAY